MARTGQGTRAAPDGTVRRRAPLPLYLAIALPLVLAVAVAVIALRAPDEVAGPAAGAPGSGAAPAETGPLALVPVEAPDADGAECAAVLAALPPALPGRDGPLPARPLAEPAQPGVRAWAAAPRPAVLRCGLTRPSELSPTSALLVVNGVQWLELDDGVPEPVVVTYVAVDRPVYVVLTAPVAAGSGPLQAVSDTLRTTLPAEPVAVR